VKARARDTRMPHAVWAQLAHVVIAVGDHPKAPPALRRRAHKAWKAMDAWLDSLPKETR
jgi:hypothetical protein